MVKTFYVKLAQRIAVPLARLRERAGERETGVPVRLGMMSLLVLALVSVANPAVAADDKKDGKEQARRFQQKLHALEQEKSQLAQEKSQLEGQFKDASEQLDHTKRSAAAASRKVSALDKALKEAEGDKAELADKLAKSEQKLAETEKILADTAGVLRQTQISKNQLDASLTQRTQEFSACTTKNESLHRMGAVLLKKYQEKSCLTSVLEKEPLTQLKGVDAENMVEEYREKLDQELVDQQLEARQKLAQQKAEAEAQKAEQKKLELLQAEQVKAEALQAEQDKAKQQKDLDLITRKVKEIFSDSFISEGLF